MMDMQDCGPRGRYPQKGEWGGGPADLGVDAAGVGGRGATLMNVANAALRRAFFSCTSSFPLEVSRDRTHDSTDDSSDAGEDDENDPRVAGDAAVALPDDLEFTREAPTSGQVAPGGELPSRRQQQPAVQPGRCAEIDEGGLTLTIPVTRRRTGGGGSPQKSGQDGPQSTREDGGLDHHLLRHGPPGAHHDFDDDVSALTQSVCSGVIVGNGARRHDAGGGSGPVTNGLEVEHGDGGVSPAEMDALFPGPADPQGFPAEPGDPEDAVGALPSPSKFDNSNRGRGHGGRGGRKRGRRRPPPSRLDRRRSLATIQSDKQLNMLLEQDGFGEI